ncbi:FecCD family ABC transporter permease [Knoellia koreensis]|uniref:Iron ABC transporter permease n=1 Tax=Knoellia koreensis TaxID=2730921 RepID=A0A849HJS3_9MICO|nr:iron ABC transporter permease [Knoellia sp. DB2414S]NNM47542.1 iron ABC transporter permease [Knoellia sp. DB2414S]
MTLTNRTTRPALAVTIALAVLAAGVVASLHVGSRMLSPEVVWAALTDPRADDADHAVVTARVARTVLALLAGGALGLAGAAMQGLTRNPLGDPGILGINAGAALGMVTAVALLGVTSLPVQIWFALAGAAVAGVLVHAIAGLGRDGATPIKLAVAGAAATAGFTSWTSALLITDLQTLETFRFWQVGTVGGRGVEVVGPVLPFLLTGAVLALTGARLLDVLALGDDLARGLGRRAGLDRLVVGLSVILLAGAATALAGPIAFVGLVAPHAARILLGPSYFRILPMSVVIGAALVTWADVVGRVILPPTEVQVGIMTAVIGVPVFFALVRRGRMGSL